MPTLHWIGKTQVINHHQDVPFRLLDYRFSIPSNTDSSTHFDSENKIIHGDNLEALKALLINYEGLVKCIYIDPPYNTGNESWIYNDNVNDPKLKKWLGQVVGKESEDLSRHDKWLCMMYPRLKLLHKLLAEDGSIWISIDDNEVANLRSVMDEIFGTNCFVTNIIWQKRYTRSNNTDNFTNVTEHIIVYSKRPGFKPNLLIRSSEANDRYSNPDNDERGPWKAASFLNQVAPEARPNLCYEITNPNTGESIFPTSKAWRSSKESWEKMIEENRVWWGKDGKSKSPSIKRFLTEVKQGIAPINFWSHEFAGHTDAANFEIKQLFGKKLFDTPKPTQLIERILEVATDKESIVLDSFAGSGTTAHAVLKLNQQDGGNRKFILTEMEDYAEHITAERVKRVMQGYAGQPGTGGSFDYLTLGEPVFTDSGELNEGAGLPGLRQYIYYAETKQALPPAPAEADNTAFLALHDDTAYYFHYEPDTVTTLNHDFLATMRTRAGQYIIYADNCLLPAEFLTQHGIIFKKIPRDISRF